MAVCSCTESFTGPLCETFLPCSNTVPCKNNGTCYKNKCFCAPNYKGVTCETYSNINFVLKSDQYNQNYLFFIKH